jgi:hypothetical protein
LWSGLLPSREAAYAAGLVTRGFIPHRQTRGACLVRFSTPSLWPFVARALGFTVEVFDTPCVDFLQCLWQFFPTARLVHPNLDYSTIKIVFCDSGEAAWKSVATGLLDVPHVFEASAGKFWAATPGWRYVQRSFSHASVGGVTTGWFDLGLLLPDVLAEDVPRADLGLPAQSATPLLNVLVSTVSAVPFTDKTGLAELERMSTPTDALYLGTKRGLINPRGLLPKLWPFKVVVPCVFSPSGWGVRYLTEEELAGAWDLPILLSDALKDDLDNGEAWLKALRSGQPSRSSLSRIISTSASSSKAFIVTTDTPWIPSSPSN